LSLVFFLTVCRWKPFDHVRNFPDLGTRFIEGERIARLNNEIALNASHVVQEPLDRVTEDKRDLDWAAVLKRTFEAYIRGEIPNMYGDWLEW
jgi:WD repeat and SOF domain-containing protein 1